MSEQEAALRIGEALGRLRRERGLSQAEAGARIGMTSQGWSLYESGRRAGLFRPDMQKRLARALDATPEDLMLMAALPSPAPPTVGEVTGMQSKGRLFEAPVSCGKLRQRFCLATDDMEPWASADTVIEYETGRPPQDGRGAVVLFHDGRLRVGLWQGADAACISLSNGGGEVMRLSRREIMAVSAVTARIEPD